MPSQAQGAQVGCRWTDAAEAYGLHDTLYRFVRWAAKGVWVDAFHALAAAGGPPATILIETSAVKAHRCAAGGKGGGASGLRGDRPLARRTPDNGPCADRRPLPTGCLSSKRRAGGGMRNAEPPRGCCSSCRTAAPFMPTTRTTLMRSAVRSRPAVPCARAGPLLRPTGPEPSRRRPPGAARFAPVGHQHRPSPGGQWTRR